ncbi:MAG: hypothetical protein ACE5KM_17655 [Planctomycetaceae bacterium]
MTMGLGGESHCINHSDAPAVDRCRQCGVPYCAACRVVGPRGGYCSVACRAKHEKYAHQAEELDRRIARGRMGGFAKLLVLITLIAGAAAALHFAGVTVPVLSDLIRRAIP